MTQRKKTLDGHLSVSYSSYEDKAMDAQLPLSLFTITDFLFLPTRIQAGVREHVQEA